LACQFGDREGKKKGEKKIEKRGKGPEDGGGVFVVTTGRKGRTRKEAVGKRVLIITKRVRDTIGEKGEGKKGYEDGEKECSDRGFRNKNRLGVRRGRGEGRKEKEVWGKKEAEN